MFRLSKGLLATTLALGLWAVHANAQDKHVTTISTCTVIGKPGAYQVGKVIQASERELIAVPPGSVLACILIDADFVTLDLGGNAIIGPGTDTSFGIFSIRRGLKVHSGTVTNFGQGVTLIADSLTVEHLNASENTISGIIIFPSNGNRVIGNIANNNGTVGIQLGCPSVVIGNMAIRNGTSDIQTFGTCTRLENS